MFKRLLIAFTEWLHSKRGNKLYSNSFNILNNSTYLKTNVSQSVGLYTVLYMEISLLCAETLLISEDDFKYV